MPYKKSSELPKGVKNALPERAEEVWKKAFNNAKKQYSDPSKRDDPSEDVEMVAAKVAWNAVKEAGYKKDSESGEWKKSE